MANKTGVELLQESIARIKASLAAKETATESVTKARKADPKPQVTEVQFSQWSRLTKPGSTESNVSSVVNALLELASQLSDAKIPDTGEEYIESAHVALPSEHEIGIFVRADGKVGIKVYYPKRAKRVERKPRTAKPRKKVATKKVAKTAKVETNATTVDYEAVAAALLAQLRNG